MVGGLEFLCAWIDEHLSLLISGYKLSRKKKFNFRDKCLDYLFSSLNVVLYQDKILSFSFTDKTPQHFSTLLTNSNSLAMLGKN